MGVTTVSNSLILGEWVTKVLNNCEKNMGVEGWVGDNNILTFLCCWLYKKCHFKNLHFGQFLVFVKFRT